MRSMIFTLALFAILSPTAARADGFVGLGIGNQGQLSGELAEAFSTDANSNSSRFIAGQRYGALAIEASLFGTQLNSVSGNELREHSTLSLGVDVKYHLGLVGGLEGYGKFGLNKTWLRSQEDDDLMDDLNGHGQEYGLGLQYSFGLPMAQASLWLDYTIQDTKLTSDTRSISGDIRMFNLGVSLGF